MDASLFSDEPAPESQAAAPGENNLFSNEPAPEGFLKTAAKNVVPDLESVGSTMKEMATPWPVQIVKHTAQGVAKAADKAAAGESAPGVISDAINENIKPAIRPFVHPIDYAKEHPVQQAINLLGAFMGAKGMMKGEAAPAMSEIETPKPPAIEPPGPSGPAESAPPGESALPPPSELPAPKPTEGAAPKIPFIDEAKQVLGKADDVKNYISRGYEGFAKKPGMTEAVADYVQSKSQKMAAQEIGMSPLQARKMGPTAQAAEANVRAIGQYALDSGIVSPTNSLRGMLTRHAELLDAAGKKIGAIRDMADKLHKPETQAVDVLQAIQDQIGDEYSEGMPGAKEYETALKIVEKSEPTFSGAAETATKLNKLANTNNAIQQPHKPFTDVANIISEVNNERIKQVVGPKNAEIYDGALKEFGVNKKIGEMLKRKVGGEVKRFGPGSATSNLIQKGMDEFGYKAGAKITNKLSTSILKNPSLAKSLPALFKGFINQVEDLGDEITGMAEGGMVPDVDMEIHHHLRKEFDPAYAGAQR